MNKKYVVPEFLDLKKSAIILLLLILLHLIVNNFASIPAQSTLESMLWYLYMMICLFTCSVYHQLGISFYREVFCPKFKSRRDKICFIFFFSVLTTCIVVSLLTYDLFSIKFSLIEIFFENFNWFYFLFIGILTTIFIRGYEKIDNVELIDIIYWANILVLLFSNFFENTDANIIKNFLNGIFAFYLFTTANVIIKNSYNS